MLNCSNYHQRNKQEDHRWYSQKAYPFATIHSAHWPAQSFCYQVHGWHNNQCHKESESQAKNDRPA